MTWKVMATANGYFNKTRVRKGEIFYIQPKKGKTSPDKGLTDFLVDIEMSEEDQFSKRWMIHLNEPINEEEDQEHNNAIYAKEKDASKVIKKAPKMEVEDDEPKAKEKPKPQKKKPGPKPKLEEVPAGSRDDEKVI